jgi:mRNA interferase HigB
MRIISKRRLREFWRMPGHENSEAALLEWYDTVRDCDLAWHNFAEIKATYASASIFQDCVIFNIGGNKYRLIARLRYPSIVYVVHVLTHRDYDKGSWKADCRCADRRKKRRQNGTSL